MVNVLDHKINKYYNFISMISFSPNIKTRFDVIMGFLIIFENKRSIPFPSGKQSQCGI